jgi:hypothetical protein
MRAAFVPHLLDVTKCRKLLARDLLDAKIPAVPLFPESADCHATERKCDLSGLFEAHRGVWAHLALDLGAGHDATANSFTLLSRPNSLFI